LKSQNVGFTAEFGTRLPDTYYKSKNYYGLGFFYAKSPINSKLGFRTVINLNMRGFSSESLGGLSFITQNTPTPYLGETNESTTSYSLTINVGPTLNLSNKLQLSLSPHYTYALTYKIKTEKKYYETSTLNKLVRTDEFTKTTNEYPFSVRSSFGGIFSITYQISKKIDIGASYQYSRQFKNKYYFPSYHIMNITAYFHLKSKR